MALLLGAICGAHLLIMTAAAQACSALPMAPSWPSAQGSGEASCPRVRHILTGTFNTRSLHLLAFDTLTLDLSLQHTVLAQGPHQFLVAGRTANAATVGPPDVVYATTWADPPSLSSWSVTRADGQMRLSWINTVPITATSSYVHVQPPAYSTLTSPAYNREPGPSRYLYSAGGPTGEVHALEPNTGAILDVPVQSLIFLPGGEEALRRADKTRRALRFGAHNVDVGPGAFVHVADLGRNAILTYRLDAVTGRLGFLSETPSPGDHDGPRHVVSSPDGRYVFSVTEHNSFVDCFEMGQDGTLQHIQRVNILPDGLDARHYRGDTVRFDTSGQAILATTRGMHTGTRGFVRAWRYAPDSGQLPLQSNPLVTWQTPTSGGKANAIEFAPSHAPPEASAGKRADLAVLTDDEEGLIVVLEWTGDDLVERARTKLPGRSDDGDGRPEGASHAIWLD